MRAESREKTKRERVVESRKDKEKVRNNRRIESEYIMWKKELY